MVVYQIRVLKNQGCPFGSPYGTEYSTLVSIFGARTNGNLHIPAYA